MDKKLPKRKHPRLKGYNYSSVGAYFITICVEDMRKILGEIIVGRGDLDAPYMQLSNYGLIVQKYLEQIELHYKDVFIDKYVVMPNHIHVIIRISRDNITPIDNGASGLPRPTNHKIPTIMRAFKKLTDKEFGFNMWQTSYYDHVVRDEVDYLRIWQYIDNNPIKCAYDCDYVKMEGNES